MQDNNETSDKIPRHSILKNKEDSKRKTVDILKGSNTKNDESISEENKLFAINNRPKDGLFVYSTGPVRDEDLLKFLIDSMVMKRKICKFSLAKGDISDAGIVMISDFFA